jgi:3-oxoacyl-[acyl-carrier protein] reductase
MLVDLQGKVALITGGSQGLGKSIAQRMTKSGADIVLWARTKETLEAAADEIRNEAPGRHVWTVACDITDMDQVQQAWQRTSELCPGVDIVVNNAGSSQRALIDDIDVSALHRDMDLKVTAALRIVQLALPHMRQQQWGRVINVVSIGGKAPSAGGAPTVLARAAGLALTKVMAAEGAPHGVLVNALCVGLILSEQWKRFHQREKPDMTFDEYLTYRGQAIPVGRVGESEEFANVACFLASDLASYVTGTAINVDGGLCPVL